MIANELIGERSVKVIQYSLFLRLVILRPAAFTALIALTFFADAFAEPTTNLYFGNGIHTNLEQASASAGSVCAAYRENTNVNFDLESLRDIHPSYVNEKYRCGLAFNDTQGGPGDLAQILTQKAEERDIDISNYSAEDLLAWVNLDWTIEDINEYLYRTARPGEVTETMLHGIGEAFVEAIPEALAERRDVEVRHRNQYLANLDAGERVIIIAYSQGTLFANKVVKGIREDDRPEYADSIKIISVAELSDQDNVLDDYFTADDDRAVNELRKRFPEVAMGTGLNLRRFKGFENGSDGNIVPVDYRDIFHHSFGPSYFDDVTESTLNGDAGVLRLDSRTYIDEKLISLATSMPFPGVTSPDPDIRYIKFGARNPGIPGDGITALDTNVLSRVSPAIILDQLTDGFTLSFFPVEGHRVDIISLTIEYKDGFPPCGFNLTTYPTYQTLDAPSVNGVSGQYWYFSQEEIVAKVNENLLAPNCVGASPNNLVIHYINYNDSTGRRQRLDAAAFGYGLAFATSETPGP